MRTVLALTLVAGLASAFTIALTQGALAPQAHAGAYAQQSEGSIATVDVVTLIDDLMNSDRFAPEREAKEAELNAQYLEPLQTQATELEARFNEAQAAGDQAAMQAIQIEFNALQQQAQVAQGNFSRELEIYVADQFKEAFSTVRDSAAAVAEQLGFAYVLTSGDPEEEFAEESPLSVVRTQAFTRTVLAKPEGTDVTEDVRADLNLEPAE